MDKIELQEAHEAVTCALDEVAVIKKQVDKAKGWSWFDIMSDSILGSYFKRERIKGINNSVVSLQKHLNKAVAELKDIDLDVDLHISDNRNDQLLDVWFDNIFTDARVHKEINMLQDNLKRLESQLHDILGVLNKYL